MAKPGSLPRWATGGSAKVTPVPTSGKMDLGWVSGEKPPESYLNFLLNLIYQWIQWLDSAVSGPTPTSLVVRDASGRAQFADPSVDADVDSRGARNAGIAVHDGVVNPHSSTSLATPLRLVVRDGSGRAQFVDPAAAGDADTKGARDAAIAAILAAPTWVNLGSGGSSFGTNWGAGSYAPQYYKKPDGWVVFRGIIQATGTPSQTPWFTMPAGYRVLGNLGRVFIPYTSQGPQQATVWGSTSSYPGQVGTASWIPANGNVIYLDQLTYYADA
jgi:hypothetical protein